MKNKKFILFNIVILFALVATVFLGKNALDKNYETMEPTKIADEKIDNELSEEELKEQEEKRERIHKKIRGEITELKPKNLSKKNKEDFEQFIQPNYNIYGEVEESPTPEPEPEPTPEPPEQPEQPEQPEANQPTSTPAGNTSNDEPTYTETNTAPPEPSEAEPTSDDTKNETDNSSEEESTDAEQESNPE